MAAPREQSRSFRVAAAALASAPVGFAAGAVLAGRQLATAAGLDGLAVLGYGLAGAIIAGLLVASAALGLPPKPVRIATLVLAGASFAILVYMVQDFITERLERSAAIDAAYERMSHYQLTLWAEDSQRSKFSQLEFSSETRRYTAIRPGGWRCEGAGKRPQAVALFQAMREVGLDQRASCGLRASWRTIGETLDTATHGCVAYDNALFAVADSMIEDTERKASCRRTDAQ